MLPIIVSDIDGVVCNLIEETVQRIWQDFGILLAPELCTDYNTAEAFSPYMTDVFDSPEALDKYLWARVFKNHASLMEARPYYDVLAAYRKYRAKGGHLLLYTARSHQLLDSTVAWCKHWGLPIPEMGVVDKAKWLKDFLPYLRSGSSLYWATSRTPVWVIDDSPEILRALLDLRDEELIIFKMQRPWNRTAVGELHPLESIGAALAGHK